MIPDNLLGDRLNNFKNKKLNPKLPSTKVQSQFDYSNIIELLAFIFSLIIPIFNSFIYGYSIKLLFFSHLNFLELMIAGLSVQILSSKLFNKK